VCRSINPCQPGPSRPDACRCATNPIVTQPIPTLGQLAPASDELSVSRYGSIQEALTANPGRMIYVPSGEYRISDRIHIRSDHAGLYGPGRIVQLNPEAPIVEIEDAAGVIFHPGTDGVSNAELSP
jgi:hypothetical protein